jgi:hypothetical protein
MTAVDLKTRSGGVGEIINLDKASKSAASRGTPITCIRGQEGRGVEFQMLSHLCLNLPTVLIPTWTPTVQSEMNPLEKGGEGRVSPGDIHQKPPLLLKIFMLKR